MSERYAITRNREKYNLIDTYRFRTAFSTDIFQRWLNAKVLMTLVSMHASAWCIKYIRIIFGQVDEKTNRMLIAALGKRKNAG